jgi:hypothetical protein
MWLLVHSRLDFAGIARSIRGSLPLQRVAGDRSLNGIVSDTTKIDERTLIRCIWDHTSIARRMSWSLSCNTTMVEDGAYCLMVIFDVNMHLIYGEGGESFCSLQLQIIKSSDDQSISAWTPSHCR